MGDVRVSDDEFTLKIRPDDVVVVQTHPDAEPIVVLGRDLSLVRPEVDA